MRLRFGGSVIEIDKKGLIVIFVLLVLFVTILIYSSISNKDELFDKDIFHQRSFSVQSLDEKLREEGLMMRNDEKVVKQIQGEIGNNVKINSEDDGVGRLGRNGAPHNKLDQIEIKKRDEINKLINPVNSLYKDLVIDHPNVNGRVIMAMDTISPLARKRMALATKQMSAPHRPPDEHYNINVTLSDHTSLDREIPDTRPDVCSSISYNLEKLPKVSIIIPFFNEAPTMLLRNIHSILNRTPNQLLEEIILVDDMSYDAPLLEPLEKFIENIPRIKILRNEERSGLIVSRMRGARVAKAPAILFLDAHSEVNVGWIEPLLFQLYRNPNQVLQPFIDGVDNMNLMFSSPSYYFKGTFSWDLRYTWTKLADHEQQMTIETGEPFPSPTIVGCAIAVMKDYFFNIGSFDEGMYVWGGENLELAFRAWMCGGQAVTVTCSRVGHVFKQSPNKFDGTKASKEITVQKNLIRVADVWMDGMRKFFYGTSLMFNNKKIKLNKEEIETLKERTELRKRLKCKNFEWYLYNVIPEMLDLPPMKSSAFGEIMNLRSRACWEVTEDYYIGMTYFCYEHKIIPKNNFALMKNGLLTYRDKCVKVFDPKPYLRLAECPKEDEIDSFGKWELTGNGQNWGGLKVRKTDERGTIYFWCIVQVTNAMNFHKGDQMPQLGDCNENDGFQMWAFTYAVDFTLVPEYLSVYQQNLTEGISRQR